MLRAEVTDAEIMVTVFAMKNEKAPLILMVLLLSSLRACLRLSLRNRAFKSKRAFRQKYHF
jgi:hypothetical protein